MAKIEWSHAIRDAFDDGAKALRTVAVAADTTYELSLSHEEGDSIHAVSKTTSIKNPTEPILVTDCATLAIYALAHKDEAPIVSIEISPSLEDDVWFFLTAFSPLSKGKVERRLLAADGCRIRLTGRDENTDVYVVKKS